MYKSMVEPHIVPHRWSHTHIMSHNYTRLSISNKKFPTSVSVDMGVCLVGKKQLQVLDKTNMRERACITTPPYPYLGGAEHSEGSLGSAGQPQLPVDPQVLVGLGELLGGPDLDGLDLVGGLCLDPVGGQQLLQARALRDQDHLGHQVRRGDLNIETDTSLQQPTGTSSHIIYNTCWFIYKSLRNLSLWNKFGKQTNLVH